MNCKNIRTKSYLLFTLTFLLILISSFTSPLLSANSLQVYSRSYILPETDRTIYSVIDGDKNFNTVSLKTKNATDISLIQEGQTSSTLSLAKEGKHQTTTRQSPIYNNFKVYDPATLDYKHLPTFLIARNMSDYSIGLNITYSVHYMSVLDLNNKSTVNIEKDTIHEFTIYVNTGVFYELDLKTPDTINYAICSGEYLIYNGFVTNTDYRVSLPITSIGEEYITLYLFASSDTFASLEPKEIKGKELNPNIPFVETYYSEPDLIWDEQTQSLVPNRNKEQIDLYYITLEAGFYRNDFSIINSLSTLNAMVIVPNLLFNENASHSMDVKILGSLSGDESSFFYLETTKTIPIYVAGENGKTIDYVIGFYKIEPPSLNKDERKHFDNERLIFKVDVQEDNIIALFNITHTVTIPFLILKHENENNHYFAIRSISKTDAAPTPLLLSKGTYLFVSDDVYSSVSLFFSYNILQTFDPTDEKIEFGLSKYTGMSSTFASFKIETLERTLMNFNLSLISEMNRTVIFTLYTFENGFLNSFDYKKIILGNQGNYSQFIAYGENSTNVLSFLSKRDTTDKFCFISIQDIHNNTDYSFPTLGDVTLGNETINFSFNYTETLNPIDFQDIEIVPESLIANDQGVISFSKELSTDNYTDFLFIFTMDLQTNTWYKTNILMDLAYLNVITYDFPNKEYLRPLSFETLLISERHYALNTASIHQIFYNATDPNDVIYNFEFGVYSGDIIILLAVSVNPGDTADFSLTLTPYSCHRILSIEYDKDPEPVQEDEGRSLTDILTLAAIIGGGVLVIATIAGITAAIIKKKSKPSKSAKSSSVTSARVVKAKKPKK